MIRRAERGPWLLLAAVLLAVLLGASLTSPEFLPTPELDPAERVRVLIDALGWNAP